MMILVTGGSKNGKSSFAERIIEKNYGLPRFYIATMQPFGEEAHEAIQRHRKIRSGKQFVTIEKYTDIDEVKITEKSAVLLECICNLCANEMFSKNEKDPVFKIISAVKKLTQTAEFLVLITNQVGSDGIEYSPETMDYVKNMGLINQKLAEMADMVVELVYGIPIILKGEQYRCLL